MKDIPKTIKVCPECNGALLMKESETKPVFKRLVCLCGWESKWVME